LTALLMAVHHRGWARHPRPRALSRTACTHSTDGERNQNSKATDPITV